MVRRAQPVILSLRVAITLVVLLFLVALIVTVYRMNSGPPAVPDSAWRLPDTATGHPFL